MVARAIQKKPLTRCSWAGDKPHMIRYHDREWGRPVHHDQRLFEMLLLEGAQAGLSWDTILRRREGYRTAFAGFDPAKVAKFTANERRVAERSRHHPQSVEDRRGGDECAGLSGGAERIWVVRSVCLAVCRLETNTELSANDGGCPSHKPGERYPLKGS